MDEQELIALSKKKILFVCTGNTCRSPMAEALLRSRAADVEVKSAGIHALPSMPASDGTRAILEEKAIAPDHTSQAVSADLLTWADLVLTMTRSHKEAIQLLFPETSEHVHTLKEFVDDESEEVDIADPIGGSLEDYRQTAKEIERCLDKLTHKLANL
ncbi:low molecular weight protein arginine phosphatase [Halalkalibacter oceani]|uniref:Low molecular weight protein arginine phosphatase n=1 Tax=Halalkalibacter oceani TaxID=1653776 RepID=A0A9X2DP03_9BACI|nr:low molecular weight protein arginine phosphatase [Halalkalibacter oceani]MCM3714269.1 low molecular weight protein arginine phosphatase [Halalkalibacter oceani]